jgi:uncharacterized protein (TIGR04255 family)
MPLDLPAPIGGALARSPLALVAWQVRYGDPGRPLTGVITAELRQGLERRGFSYPRVDQVQLQNVNIDIGSGVANRELVGRGYRLQTADSRWIVTVAPETVTLETTRYGSWRDDFQPRLQAIVDAFAEIVAPRVEARIGLRYVDVMTEPYARAAIDWRSWIAQELLGPIAHSRLGPGISVIQQQFTIELDTEVRATVRHGAYPDPSRENAFTYLLDTDVFRETLVAFDTEAVRQVTDRLHDWNLRLFQQIITQKMLAHLSREATPA